MRFKEYYLTEQAKGKDPREKEKVKFFGGQIKKVFGVKIVVKKERNDWIYIFKSKGLNLGRTSLSIGTETFGDIIFGESSGIFAALDSDKAKEKIKDAYENKFGARGREGEKTFKQFQKERERERAKRGARAEADQRQTIRARLASR